MGKKSGPPAPDYSQTANAQTRANRQDSFNTTVANRPTVQTPWGSQTWDVRRGAERTIAGTADNGAEFDAFRYYQANPDVREANFDAREHYEKFGQGEGRQGFWRDVTVADPDEWTQRIELSPQQQAALDSQMAVQTGRSRAAEGMLSRATDSLSRPMDAGSLPARSSNFQVGSFEDMSGIDPSVRRLDAAPRGELAREASIGPMQFGTQNPGVRRSMDATAGDWRQRAQQAALDFQRPLLQERRSAVEAQLANQGLARGSEAWNREMRNLADAEDRAGLQAFGEGRAEASMLFDQDFRSGTFENTARAQEFGQNLQSGQFANQAQNQLFNQLMANARLSNDAQQQGFTQDMAGRTFENSAGQQQFENRLNLSRARDDQDMRILQALISAGNFNNTNRQSALQEQIMLRNQPLNELNALLTGQQVGMPEMPRFNSATPTQPTDLLGAAQQQYGASTDQYNANMARSNANTQALSSLAMMAFMFSDARLKEDIRPTGDSIDGIPVVHYRYRGLPGRYIGVIAQDVLKVKPEAVALHPSGFLMVNYQELMR